MNKFLFKSNDSDLQKINSIYKMLETIQKNVLYETHQVDKILKTLNELQINNNLQKQVDDFYPNEEESEHIPEESKE